MKNFTIIDTLLVCQLMLTIHGRQGYPKRLLKLKKTIHPAMTKVVETILDAKSPQKTISMYTEALFDLYGQLTDPECMDDPTVQVLANTEKGWVRVRLDVLEEEREHWRTHEKDLAIEVAQLVYNQTGALGITLYFLKDKGWSGSEYIITMRDLRTL